MTSSFPKLALASLMLVLLSDFVMAPYADAAGRGGGGGGGRAGAAQAGGGARQSPQVNNAKADTRTNNVRNTSVNNVNVERNVNVNVEGCSGRCGGWDHPVAAAAVVGATVAVTAAAIGSMVSTVPASCVPINYGGAVYQQCGGTWYQPQGAQFVVVNPPY